MMTLTQMRVAEVLAAASARRPGYVAAAMAAGRRFEQDGQDWIEWTEEAFNSLRSAFGGADGPPIGGCGGCGG